jgi:hypothetical protein
VDYPVGEIRATTFQEPPAFIVEDQALTLEAHVPVARMTL